MDTFQFLPIYCHHRLNLLYALTQEEKDFPLDHPFPTENVYKINVDTQLILNKSETTLFSHLIRYWARRDRWWANGLVTFPDFPEIFISHWAQISKPVGSFILSFPYASFCGFVYTLFRLILPCLIYSTIFLKVALLQNLHKQNCPANCQILIS